LDYKKMTLRDMNLQRNLLKAYNKAMKSMPEGRLSAKRIKGKIYYYHIDEKTRKQTYIPKKQLELIHQLKQKRWMKKAIKIMEKNLKFQEELLKHYEPYDHHYLQKLLPQSDSDKILEEYEYDVLPDLDKWAAAPYRKNPYHPEELRHTTSFGLKVRSKSEMMIAELLHGLKIPFHYDAAIRIIDMNHNEKFKYVDFLIKLPQGGFIVWEHMGMFTMEDYRENQFVKLTEYFFNDIYMGKNLIITMDGPNGEFDNLEVERIIKGQILPHFR